MTKVLYEITPFNANGAWDYKPTKTISLDEMNAFLVDYFKDILEAEKEYFDPASCEATEITFDNIFNDLAIDSTFIARKAGERKEEAKVSFKSFFDITDECKIEIVPHEISDRDFQ